MSDMPTAPATTGKGLLKDEAGSVTAELALLMPVISMLLFGTIYFGIALTNYQQLTFGVLTGARSFAMARGSATPYSAAVSAAQTAAPNLTPASIALVFTVNGTSCASDSACSTALSTATGLPAKLAGTYPCNLVVPFATTVTTCTLSTASSLIVE